MSLVRCQFFVLSILRILVFILELDILVSKVHLECVGESRSVLSTLDKLKRIELKMEMLTKELEQMPEEKVVIAQKVEKIQEIIREF